MRKRIVIALCLAPVLHTTGQAQEKPEPPGRTSSLAQPDSVAREAMPTMTLPEFEIAGDEVIRIGGAAKPETNEPWNLRPTTLEDHPGRQSPLAALGTAPSVGHAADASGFTGRSLLGIGSFQSPTLDLWLGVSSPTTGLLLRSGYGSSAGHVDHADFREGVASIAGSHTLGSGTFIPGGTMAGKLGFSGRAYRFYGSTDPELQRTTNRVQGAGSVSGEANDFVYDAGFFLNHLSVSDNLTSRENETGLRVTGTKKLEEITFDGTLDLWTNSYAAPSIEQNPFLIGLSIDARYEVTSSIIVKGGLGLSSSRGSVDDAQFRLLPLAGIFWQATETVNLSARFAPFLQRSNLSWLQQQHPYLVNSVHVKHQDYHTNLELVADLQPLKAVSASVVFRYQRADDVPVYAEMMDGQTGLPTGRWNIDYSGTTRIFGLDAEVSADVATDGYVTFSVAWREATNSMTDGPLPYAPKIQCGASYRHSFPFGMVVQTDLNFYGPQFADQNGVSALNGYTLWDATAEYEVLSRFNVGFGLQNILDQSYERWRGYVGIPRTALFFGRYSW